MITNELERMFGEFIAVHYNVSHTVTNSDLSAYTVEFVGGAIAGQILNIRCGETTESQTLPKLVITATEGEEDYDTGNQLIDLEVAISYPVDPTTEVSDQFARLNTETIRMRDLLVVDDLPNQLLGNVFTTFNALVIGVAGRSTSSEYDGHMRTHKLTLRLYCAGLETP